MTAKNRLDWIDSELVLKLGWVDDRSVKRQTWKDAPQISDLQTPAFLKCICPQDKSVFLGSFNNFSTKIFLKTLWIRGRHKDVVNIAILLWYSTGVDFTLLF